MPRRRRGAEATAEVLADVFIGVDTSRERLTCRFESIVLSARVPRLQQVLIDRRNTLRDIHFEVLEKSGRSTDPSGIEQLMVVEDGVVIGALADSVQDVVKVTRTALSEVIDQLAPVAAV